MIGPDGAVVWMCFPRWDSPAVFSSLIGGPGFYAVTPSGRYVWGGYYEEGTLIWRSRWVTTDAVIECREALACPGRTGGAVLLRRLVGLEGTAEVRVTLHARAGYGAAPLRRPRQHDDGSWSVGSDVFDLRWSGAREVQESPDGHRGHRLDCTVLLTPGKQHDLVLELDQASIERSLPDADAEWEATEQHWRSVVPPMTEIEARRDARHAYAVLSGLSSSSGGMVASATTSLPERAEAGRSYDYRYVWIRDQCFSGQAVAAVGPLPLLDEAVRFVEARLLADGPSLQPAYTVRGERVPDERSLELPGYPGGADVIGNHVNAQFQLDALGEALLLFAAAARHDHLDADGWREWK